MKHVHRVQTQPGITLVHLWYPGPDEASRHLVEVELVHVRAARGIQIEYDFERDGYAIRAQDTSGDPTAPSPPYEEVAFVAAWTDQAEA